MCVCVIHQSVILLLDETQIKNYKQLLETAVCDMTKSNCMLQRCLNCPGNELVRDLLRKQFEDHNEDISIKQWVSVDRIEMITRTVSILQYNDLVLPKQVKLTHTTSYLIQSKDK